MSQWADRAEELLYDGEAIAETVDIGDARVVVTSHRVLAFTPGTDGPTFRQADRPNVAGVSTGARAEAGLLERALKFGVVGGVLLAAGVVLDFGEIVGDVDLTGGQAAGQVGLGGILGTMSTVLAVLRNLDAYMRLFGALALLLGAVLFGVYWWLRDATVVLEVEGEEDIHLPSPDSGTDEAVERLERAIEPGPAGRGGRPETGDGDKTY